MQRVILFALMLGLLAVFYFYQQRTIRSVATKESTVPEGELLTIEGVRSSSETAMSFEVNADSLDQYLSEENPFYNGGYKPELTSYGVLTPAAEKVLEQYAIFEFLEQQEFGSMGADAPILEYPRADRVGDGAAAMAGRYRGTVELQGKTGEVWLQMVPTGGDGLVYDIQWSFAAKSVLRFRRIPSQPHWLNAYLPTAWADEEAFRLEIPRGAVTGSGLSEIPLGPGIAVSGFTGYELRGRRGDTGQLTGDVFAVGRTEKLGESWNLAEHVGTFAFLPDSAGAEP